MFLCILCYIAISHCMLTLWTVTANLTDILAMDAASTATSRQAALHFLHIQLGSTTFPLDACVLRSFGPCQSKVWCLSAVEICIVQPRQTEHLLPRAQKAVNRLNSSCFGNQETLSLPKPTTDIISLWFDVPLTVQFAAFELLCALQSR